MKPQQTAAHVMEQQFSLNQKKNIFFNFVLEQMPGFILDKDNKEVIRLLFAYAERLEEFEGAGYDLNKGILLYGPVGSGKTRLMRALQQYLRWKQSPLSFNSTTMLKVSELFLTEGFTALQQFYNKHWFFDELGHKESETAQSYGNKINIAERIINKQESNFNNGFTTHFTTNLTPAELADYLDGRTYSRLSMLCNFILLVSDLDHRPQVKARQLQATPAEPEPIPELTEAEKLKVILAEIEYMKAGGGFRFLDWGNIYLNWLKDKGAIPDEIPAEIIEQERAAAITQHQYKVFDSMGRAELRRFREAPVNEPPAGNEVTKTFNFKVERRLLKECLEAFAAGTLSTEILEW